MHISQQNNYIFETNSVNPWYNLAIEEYLESGIKQGDVILYLWQNDRTVVLGRNQNVLKECKAHELENEGGYLARRSTGGGAVYQDLGNLCFTFLTSPERYDLEKQAEVIRRACLKYQIPVSFTGRNDVVTQDGYKISGNAFSATSKCKLQHGTLLIHVDLDRMEHYLTPSLDKMNAKGIASVRSRVCNLQEMNPLITVSGMKNALKEAYVELYGNVVEQKSTHWRLEEIQQLYEKHASWEWRYGKSPNCEIVYQKHFGWGELEVQLVLQNLHISKCKIYSDTLDIDLPVILEQILPGQRYDLQNISLENLKYITDCEKEKLQEILQWLGECMKGLPH